MRMGRASLFAVLLALVAASIAQSQEVRGSVRDSASRQPIAGAVLMLLDSSGSVLGRNISDERGQYRIALSSGIRRMRVQRIGFRRREVEIPPATNGIAQLDIAMMAIPMLLEPVRVSANPSCARRDDDAAAFALLEQARSGLLATLVAREAKPPALVRYTFERAMDGTTDRARTMTVQKDSVGRTITSFSAVHSAADFVRRGFVDDDAREQTFFAPDAEVLLDSAFANGYCFRVVRSGRERGGANQIGLGFVAADRKRGRVDVDGVLWIDTVARALRDMEFRYAGLDSRVERYRPGGTISFREMPNGAVLIDRWTLRLIGASTDSLPDDGAVRAGGRRLRGEPASQSGSPRFYASESGGELAHARWSDTESWHAALGTLNARVLTVDGQPAVGVSVSLSGTPYRAVSDSTGQVIVRDLVPGPYSIVVIDSALLAIDLTIPTTGTFVAARDSTVATSFVARNADEYVVRRCMDYGRYTYAATDSTRVIARITDDGGRPMENVRWQARVNSGASATALGDGNSWVLIPQHGVTGTDGVLQICSPALRHGATIEIEAWRDGTRTTVRRRLAGRPTVIRIPFEPRH